MAARKQVAEKERGRAPVALRGCLIRLKNPPKDASALAVVLSNNVQNEISSFVLIAPLVRVRSRMNAPFAVDLGRREGMRDLHAARCDWVMRLPVAEIKNIERSSFGADVLDRLDSALRVALALH